MHYEAQVRQRWIEFEPPDQEQLANVASRILQQSAPLLVSADALHADVAHTQQPMKQILPSKRILSLSWVGMARLRRRVFQHQRTSSPNASCMGHLHVSACVELKRAAWCVTKSHHLEQ